MPSLVPSMVGESYDYIVIVITRWGMMELSPLCRLEVRRP